MSGGVLPSARNSTARKECLKKVKKFNRKHRPAGFGKKKSAGRRDSGTKSAGGIRENISAGGIRKIISDGRRDSENNFGRKKRSVSQMKDQVMTMKTHTESSKSELSSGTFDHVKVCKKFWGFRFGRFGNLFGSVGTRRTRCRWTALQRVQKAIHTQKYVT